MQNTSLKSENNRINNVHLADIPTKSIKSDLVDRAAKKLSKFKWLTVNVHYVKKLKPAQGKGFFFSLGRIMGASFKRLNKSF